MKGSFYKEENGAVESHQYTLKVTQPTTVWMTIKPSAPKYGNFFTFLFCCLRHLSQSASLFHPTMIHYYVLNIFVISSLSILKFLKEKLFRLAIFETNFMEKTFSNRR